MDPTRESYEKSFHKQHENELVNLINNYESVLEVVKKSFGPEKAFLASRKMIDEMKIKSNYDKSTSCGSCSFCCHDSIYVGDAEADYIKKVVLEKGVIPNRHRIEEQKKNDPAIKYADKACPLLQDPDPKTGARLCSIYEDRPLICRTHNSVESPEFCDREKYPGRFVGEIKVLEIEALMIASIAVGAKNKEAGIYMKPLHLIL